MTIRVFGLTISGLFDLFQAVGCAEFYGTRGSIGSCTVRWENYGTGMLEIVGPVERVLWIERTLLKIDRSLAVRRL